MKDASVFELSFLSELCLPIYQGNFCLNRSNFKAPIKYRII